MESYFIVKSILRSNVDIARVVHRDTQTYFGILLDDNNRNQYAECTLMEYLKSMLQRLMKMKKEIKHEIHDF